MKAKFLPAEGCDGHPIIKAQRLQDEGSWAIEALRNPASKDYEQYKKYHDDWRYRRVYENLTDEKYRQLKERDWTVDDSGQIAVKD